METNVSNAAWQTPASLLKLAARTAAEALIHSTVPSNIFSDTWYQNVDDEYDKDRFDETYRCLTVALTHPDDKQYAKEKEHLICTLSELRHWWDGQDGLALLPAKLQKEVHYYIIDCLESECFVCIEHEDILDCECFNCLSRIGISGISCLFRWLRMLLFSGQTKGKLLPMIKLDSVGCAAFACLLDSLAPFPRIQWLDFEPCSFMEPVLIKTILKNSPNIRSLRIGEKSIKFLNYVEMFCPNLELLYMHDPGYSDNLYELFFSGISKETVRKIIKCNGRIKITFPHLKVIQHAWSCGEFSNNAQLKRLILVLLHCYPQLESITSVREDGLNTKTFSPDPDGDILTEGIPKSPSKIHSVLLPTYIKKGRGQAFDTILDKVAQLCPEANHLTLQEDEDIKNVALPKGSLEKLTRVIKFTSLRLEMGKASLKRYAPNVYAIADNITNLEYVVDEENRTLLFEIINSCINLECLKVLVNEAINVSVATNENSLVFLPNLAKISINYPGYDMDVCPLLKCVSKVAPNIKNLNVYFQDHCDITDFCSIVSAGLLNKVEFWTLSRPRSDSHYRVLADYLQDFIEQVVRALPCLTKLSLCLPEPTTIDIDDFKNKFDKEYLKCIYRNSSLLVIDGSHHDYN